MKKILFLSLSILLFSCSKKEPTLSKDMLLDRAESYDSSLVISNDKSAQCSDYGSGCLSTQMLILNNLSFVAVEFTSEKEAIQAAKRIKGYYVENWIFDDVRNEPILERFAVHGLQAKMP